MRAVSSFLRVGPAVALSVALAGCAGPPKGAEAPPPGPGGGAPPPVARPTTGAGAAKIEIEDGAGATLFQLQSSAKGFQVEDADGRKIASVKVEADRVKLADAEGRPAFKVKQKDGGFKLYREPASPGGADVELANFWTGPGELQIKDGSDRLLYKGKAKGDKTEVAGPAGRNYVLKPKPDGYEVEDPAGKRLARLKGLSSAGAALFAAAPEYDVLQKAAVAAYTAGVGR